MYLSPVAASLCEAIAGHPPRPTLCHGRRFTETRYKGKSGSNGRAILSVIPDMNRRSFSAILSVAYKEFLHIYRDRRVLILLLILPPAFTLMFGYAFEAGEVKNVPAMLVNRDQTERAEKFVKLLQDNKT